MPIQVIIADDHKLFREGIVSVIEKFKNIAIIGEAENGKQLLALLKEQKPDVILLDLNMPGMDGFETLDKLKQQYPDAKVIVLSMYNADSYITAAVDGGACGYLHKNDEPQHVIEAIESVYTNGFYFNDKVNKAMVQGYVKRKKLYPVFNVPNLSFTEPEIQVIKLVSCEKSNKEIADELNMSTRTAEGIRQRLIKKTGVKNSVGLALFAVKNGLVEL